MGLVAFFAVFVNFLVVPMFNDIDASVDEISVGQVSATNSTGNTTAQYQTDSVGLFGNPAQQLNTMLIILGISGGVAAVAILGTGAQPGPAAVVAFIVAIALIVVNVLLQVEPMFSSVPFLGVPTFITIVAFVFFSTLLVAAGIMSSSGAD